MAIKLPCVTALNVVVPALLTRGARDATSFCNMSNYQRQWFETGIGIGHPESSPTRALID
jgi:hypothetical protein